MTQAQLFAWADQFVNEVASGWRAIDTRAGALVLVSSRVVVKLHRSDTSWVRLCARLDLLGEPGISHLWAPLLRPEPVPVPAHLVAGGRFATVWGRLDTLDPDQADLPWAEAGSLLARLHMVGVDGPQEVLADGAADRLARALGRLESAPGTPAVRVVLAAGRAIADDLGRAPSHDRGLGLAHGDWHLGQVGRSRDTSTLLLLDADDLGRGRQAWDLARPAGFWASGILPDADWNAFLSGYRNAGGPAVPASGDPWPWLEAAARAAVVIAASAGLRDDLDADHADAETTLLLVDACARMANLGI